MRHLPYAVHCLNTFRYNDDKGCPDKHAGAEQTYEAELPLRERKGEREDAGQEGAVGELSDHTVSQRSLDTHAIPMIVLKVSNINNPSHMLAVLMVDRYLGNGLVVMPVIAVKSLHS